MTDSQDSLPPEAFGPPAVVLDDAGVTAWLTGKPAFHIRWKQVEKVSITVTVYDTDWAEAFWSLTGAGQKLGAPVDMVVNADQLKDRLFALPGFDMTAYEQARQAESDSEEGEFVCWSRDWKSE